MTRASREDAPEEPEEQRLADNGENGSARSREEVAPTDPADARGSAELSVESQYQAIVEDFIPQLNAFREQQRIAGNLIEAMGGFDRLGEQVLAAQSAIELVRDQQPLIENLLKAIGAAGGLPGTFDALFHLDAFREFTRSAAPALARLSQQNLLPDWYPPNWEAVPDFTLDAALDIIVDEGIPLVWVPRPTIVAELVAAADAGTRDGILLSLCDDIAHDCLVVLDEITAQELKPLAELAADAVSALRDGHGPSAQALAANVFDTLLRDAARRGVIFVGPPIGYFKYDKVQNRITPVSDDTVIGRFRADCVLSAARAALQNYNPSARIHSGL